MLNWLRRLVCRCPLCSTGIERISVAQFKPDDVIVVECKEPLKAEGAEEIKRWIEQVWPEHKVVVLDASFRIRIAPGEEFKG